MGEQGSYRRPPWQAGSERVSLEALEVAFGEARQGPGHGNEPDCDDARLRQPEVSGRRPSTNRPGPPWPAVVATTVRLRLRRRRVALGRLFRRRWAIALAVLAVTALLVGGLAVAFPRQGGIAPAAGQKAAHTGTLTRPVGQDSGAAAAGHAAAVWVARQVSREAMVACDPGMCRMLQAQGFPAGSLLVLRPGAAGLRFCDVIVATQAVRNLLGSRLQRENAPAVIAGFGSGEARIDVRAVAPGGAAAYRAAFAADWAARRRAAAQLVKSPRIHAGGAARQELLSGMVDSRVLIMLAALAVSHPVNVVAFGDSAPGASAGVPLREMEISGTGSPVDRSAELQRIRSSVLAQHAVFLPAQVSLVRLADGGAALRIEFGAPSPLGLLLGRPVTQ
jgi:hypothetical protein